VAPTKDHLLVFFLQSKSEWEESCKQMLAAGFRSVLSSNPYWERRGRTFEDIDGYRVVWQNEAWSGSLTRPFRMSETRLETERLTLRMLRESDFEPYAEMVADAEVMRFIADGHALSRPLAWRNLALMVGHWQLRGYGPWAVEERSTGQLVGRIGFWKPEGWPGFELGWILRRQFWGRGYASEGARAALDFGFTHMQEPEVISLIYPDNAASIRVALRLGEQLAGRLELMGRTALVYHITRAQWTPAAR
jgi:RimJ/RimL family protein N-acetyltransferase